ncbi:MAG: 5-(carboxyamino)imidazole ribonucleotide mutase [Synechococcus sp. SB0665_bin_28]|nr:5-(carboxyamino)imidazole ribonucleotide mutase [Synechococcus sp. SB0665_bin_28]MYF20510.1 5-(carboxyamino)imidazole ribonucleotide mutase [Synechococcus sp. SB0677_bin_5]
MDEHSRFATQGSAPPVGIVMGSDSDLPTMEPAAAMVQRFGVGCEVRILSAHRTPLEMVDYARTAAERDLKVIIAGAGGAAHLPGMVASLTVLPVIGVPVQSKALAGVDSLYSIAQMPTGVPVATVAIGNGANAGLLALQILATADPRLTTQLHQYRDGLQAMVREKDARLHQQRQSGRPDLAATLTTGRSHGA